MAIIKALALLLVAVSLGAAGQLLLKAGLRQLPASPPPLVVLKSIFTNAMVFGGYMCYGVSSLLYVVAISRLDLSYAYPLVAVSYVLVTVGAWHFFDETVPPLRWVGLAVIMLGVVIFALSHRQTTPEAPPPAVETEVLR